MEIIFCPKCIEMPEMDVVDRDGVEMDICPKCEGIWFDKGELSQKLNIASDFPDFYEVLDKATNTTISCPRCQDVKFVELRFMKDEPVLIDFCQRCKGIWLDGGELNSLKKISGRSDLDDINFLQIACDVKGDL